ncbi:MAG TPA: 30S ribosomal protein S12 methylthiotransferase RimO [Bacteroidales bacterium]|nr:30S ribosomal protein S12 methylthiotransferase RimO [Bacteroidales bacterium]HOS58364.1 30S ribosomal protein S12 methylthiotransferase RimO [Bacteroidales bacterium]HRR04884.1 30S ribosomal protein S12 methylthiotransferase RimO [Bacteroidales bacterium]
MMKQSINLITLGCSKNIVDSEIIAAQFEQLGYKVYHETEDDTDIIIINTCGFILDAKEQSIETILFFLEKKQKESKLFVIGCLAERYKKELEETLPEVDGFYGFSELSNFFDLFKIPPFNLLHPTHRLLSTPSHYAYLKISEGCDRQCAFCAIPTIRGKHISKPKELLITEAKTLVEKGVKEIMLIAQDLTYYGIDLYKKRSLASLLQELAQIKGLEWIRLHYAYPVNFPYEILDVINDYKNICRYIDIPFQHINDNILKTMRRGHTASDTYQLIETLRSKIPHIAIRTTLISGFPGETKKEHNELLKFIEEARFERLGIFSYSQEENTPAYSLGDPINKKEKKRRLDELMLLQQEISYELNREKINTTLKVIIDDENDNFYLGRTEFDSPEVDNGVLIDKEEKLEIGNFYNARIINANTFDLVGKIAKEYV